MQTATCSLRLAKMMEKDVGGGGEGRGGADELREL